MEERNRSRVERQCFCDNSRQPHIVKGMPQGKLNCFRSKSLALMLGQKCNGHFDVLSIVMLIERNEAQQRAIF